MHSPPTEHLRGRVCRSAYRRVVSWCDNLVKQSFTAIIAILGISTAAAYEGSTFAAVSAAVFDRPYSQLPTIKVEVSALGPEGDGPDNRLRRAARRTLTAKGDLFDFPEGRKLFQANGRCFSGQWRITEQNSYSGLFSTGTHALIIMRASVSLSETTRGNKRAFALAGKVFPTVDKMAVVPTANFFGMENLLGTDDDYFLDAVMGQRAGGVWATWRLRRIVPRTANFRGFGGG
jgi:hypothetical protein